jgi:ubiquinone/menaquinone biosynthesis C-methylase UbiE
MAANSVVERYDRTMYQRLEQEFYEYSDFHNYGYWRTDTRSAKEASQELVEQLLARVPSKQGRVLDVACGLGATTRSLLRYYRPSEVVAVNVSEKQLRTTAANAPGSRVAAMDAAHLALADDSFDNAICVEAVFHFRTREAFLREAYRVLKPGGTLVLSDILFRTLPVTLNKKWVKENLVTDLDEYRAAYSRSGFTDIKVTDATVQCWGGFYRSLRRFGWAKVRAGQLSVIRFAALALWWNLVAMTTDRYLLVSAVKPKSGTAQ